VPLRVLVGLVQVEELSPRMGKTGQLDAGAAVAGVREQGFVTGIVVNHQVAFPCAQKLAGMFASPAFW